MIRLGLLGKLRKALRPGAWRNKVLPYLWFYSGLAALTALRFRRLPVERSKIVFCNMRGLGFGDHQKYVALELLRRKAPVDLVWLAQDAEAVARTLPPGVRTVRWNSSAALRELSTAGVWCVNQSLNHFILRGLRKRKGQRYVQTYHGSLGIKRIGADQAGDGTVRLWERPLRRDAEMIDDLIANATWEAASVYRTRFFGHGCIRLFGHPRNDVFFSDCSALRRETQARLGVAAGDRILLYAPTHRHNQRTDVILTEFIPLLAACRGRFGGRWKIVVRLHPNMVGYAKRVAFGPDVIDATAYPDMQELLIAADVLLSDYSSCMFDFMLTRRPVFVYAPDMAEYERLQGFYYPMSETPFPVAKDEAGLAANVAAFDEAAYRAGVEAFLKGKGCVEDGRATARVCDLIAARLDAPDA